MCRSSELLANMHINVFFKITHMQAFQRNRIPQGTQDGIRGYADDLTQYCSPTKNPAAFRHCQAVAGSAVAGLLTVAQTSTNIEMRVTVLTAKPA